jgi:DedD protein
MEKKKLLLVSVSVGLFLVIVIGASILVFSPRDYSLLTKAEAAPVPPGAPRTSVGGAPSLPVTETPEAPREAVQPPTIATAAETQPKLENVIYINGDNAENAVRVERLNDGNTRTVITIPSPREIIAVAAPPPPVETVSKPASPPSAVSEPIAAGPKAAPDGTAKAEKSAPKPAWWVQTNSYSKKAYADKAKEFLASKGITSVVMNGIVSGKTFYRVRVGPYTSQSEADYWLSLIKSIEGMENSLVWKSSSL